MPLASASLRDFPNRLNIDATSLASINNFLSCLYKNATILFIYENVINKFIS
jgi:hypothetical protein